MYVAGAGRCTAAGQVFGAAVNVCWLAVQV